MKYLAFTALLLLAGCGLTLEGDAARLAVQQYGAQAYDEGLVNAEWFICNAATIGAVRRKYGKTEEMAATYRDLCQGAGDVVLFDAGGG